MQISIGLPPGPHLPELAVLAEELGYDRLWLFDSPALYEDVWVHLAAAASATSRIGLGTGVLVPDSRHVMVTASAVATLERLAPGRMAYAFGTGYSARYVLGQPPLTWAFVRTYLNQLRSLLAGEVVEVLGRPCQMIHHPDLTAPRPLEVPLLLSAFGPKGIAITREAADGWMGASPPPEPFDWAVQMVNGTVLDPGESPASQRAIDAAGPWLVGMYHFLWENNPEVLSAVPGGDEWLAQINSERPEGQRHLSVHYGHVTHLNSADRRALAVVGDEIAWGGWVAEAEGIAQRATESAEAGTTEIMYTPAGQDMAREIKAFRQAVAS